MVPPPHEMREINRKLIEEFRANGRALPGRPLLLLTTVGARSGGRYTTPMMYVRLDGRLLTPDELATRVGELTGYERLGGKLRESWGALLKPAAALGLLCFAPTRASRSASPGPTPGWAAGPSTTPTRPWTR